MPHNVIIDMSDFAAVRCSTAWTFWIVLISGIWAEIVFHLIWLRNVD